MPIKWIVILDQVSMRFLVVLVKRDLNLQDVHLDHPGLSQSLSWRYLDQVNTLLMRANLNLDLDLALPRDLDLVRKARTKCQVQDNTIRN